MDTEYTRETLVDYLKAVKLEIAWWDRAMERGAAEAREQGLTVVTHDVDESETYEGIVYRDAETNEVVGEGAAMLHEDRLVDWYAEKHPEDPEPETRHTSHETPWGEVIDTDKPEAIEVLYKLIVGEG